MTTIKKAAPKAPQGLGQKFKAFAGTGAATISALVAGAIVIGIGAGFAISDANAGGETQINAGVAPVEEAHEHSDDTNLHDDDDSEVLGVADVDLDHAVTVWDDAMATALLAYADSNDNVEYTITADTILIEGNGIPDHETGAFPNSGNPNSISAQDVSFEITRTPTYVGTPTDTKIFGVSVGGVVFDPGTAERDATTGWSIEAFNTSGIFPAGVDFNNAHVQPDGTYHYHGIPEGLSEGDEATHSNIVGFAADGFPIYSLYGYENAEDASSDVVALESSWQLKEGTRAAGEPSGTYNGDYTDDYEFVAGSGDLDQCNGLFTVTPDFPEGTYSYFVTEEFPYVARCVMGDVSTSNLGSTAGGGPAGGPPQNGQEPPSGGPDGNRPPPPGGLAGPPQGA